MTWKKINRISDGQFLEVYETSRDENSPGYRGEDVRYWNHTHAAPEEAVHSIIPDRPSENHNWNGSAEKWELDLKKLKAQKKEILEREAREEFFNKSPQKAAMIALHDSIDTASTEEEINAVTWNEVK